MIGNKQRLGEADFPAMVGRCFFVGVAVLLAAVAGCGGGGVPSDPPAQRPAPNILVLMWDTVRADRMSCFGYDEATTPNADRLAAEGRRYVEVVSNSNWTLPSHASLFTGLYPDTHQAIGAKGWLDGGHDTLAERLAQSGYQTFLFSSNPFVSDKHNLDQGFETTGYTWESPWIEAVHRHFTADPTRGEPLKKNRLPIKDGAPVIRSALLSWLDERDPDRPFFAFLNFMEAHWPWYPTRESRQRFMSEELVEWSYQMDLSYRTRYEQNFGFERYEERDFAATSGLYDASLYELDHETGLLIDALRERGLLENTVVVLVSDHGDNLGEHGMLGHEYSLHETLLSVPIVIRYPERLEPGPDPRPAQTVDLFPTLLDLAGIEAAGHDGVNLLEEPASGMDRPQVAAYLEPKTRAVSLVSSANPDFDGRPWMSPLRSIEVDEWKLIAAKDGRRWLYDLANDPSESSDLSGQREEKTATLAQRLESWVAQHRSEEPEGERRRAEPDAEHLERLRGLGYIVGEPGEDTDTGGDDR